MNRILESIATIFRKPLGHTRAEPVKPRSRFISYIFLHGLGRMSANDYLDRFTTVMRRYASPDKPDRVEFVLTVNRDSPPILMDVYDELCYKYGKGTKYLESVEVGSRGWYSRAYSWQIAPEMLNSAMVELAAIQARSLLHRKHVGLQCSWTFRWKAPDSGLELPDQVFPELDIRQPAQAFILLTLMDTVSASLWLLFPFDSPEQASPYLEMFRSEFPVKLSDKHWRLWKQSKAGNWTPRKFTPK